ncbi:MAG: hypothetical protein D6767_03800 [Candidatus Hydrogenedentota bacterium]|nr:MAG: hypothetical protein D6767_03800 [Candidatus Hydrogenedentota bacterium]
MYFTSPRFSTTEVVMKETIQRNQKAYSLKNGNYLGIVAEIDSKRQQVRVKKASITNSYPVKEVTTDLKTIQKIQILKQDGYYDFSGKEAFTVILGSVLMIVGIVLFFIGLAQDSSDITNKILGINYFYYGVDAVILGFLINVLASIARDSRKAKILAEIQFFSKDNKGIE